MTHRTATQIDMESLVLPPDCRFRIWSRAELVVEDACVMLEGSHAFLMLELLRNRGRRVPVSLLWSAMLQDSPPSGTGTVGAAVAAQIKQIRYALCTKGIVLSIDDSVPEEGFMLSGLCRVDTKPAPMPRKRSRSRKTHRPGVQNGIQKQIHKSLSSPDVSYVVHEEIERRCLSGADK